MEKLTEVVFKVRENNEGVNKSTSDFFAVKKVFMFSNQLMSLSSLLSKKSNVF